jgi:hypothetical protein
MAQARQNCALNIREADRLLPRSRSGSLAMLAAMRRASSLVNRLLTARPSDPASQIETVKNCRPWYSPHRGDAGLRRRMRRCAICPTMSGMIERQSCARSPRECPTSTPSAPCLDWPKTTTNSTTVRPSGRQAAEPGYRRLFDS